MNSIKQDAEGQCVWDGLISDNVCAHWEGCASSTICHHRLIEGGGDRVSGSWSTRTVLGSNFFLLYAASCVFVFFYDFVWNNFSRVESFSCVNSLTTKFTFSNSRNAMKCYIGGGFFGGIKKLSLALCARGPLCWEALLCARGRTWLFTCFFFPNETRRKLSIVRWWKYKPGKKGSRTTDFFFFNNFSTHTGGNWALPLVGTDTSPETPSAPLSVVAFPSNTPFSDLRENNNNAISSCCKIVAMVRKLSVPFIFWQAEFLYGFLF